jgi:tetratricopeptide (TPR) repeat protein
VILVSIVTPVLRCRRFLLRPLRLRNCVPWTVPDSPWYAYRNTVQPGSATSHIIPSSQHHSLLAIAREIGDRRAEGGGLGNVGLAYRALGQVERAIACAEAALRIFEELKSPYAEQARRQLETLRQKRPPA